MFLISTGRPSALPSS